MMRAARRRAQFEPLNHFAAIFKNFDVQKEENMPHVLEAFLRYPLLVLRGGKALSPQNLKNIARAFGSLSVESDPCKIKAMRKYFCDSEMAVLRVSAHRGAKNGPAGVLGAGFIGWHSDLSHMETDFHGSLLYSSKNNSSARTSFCHTPDLRQKLSEEDIQKLKGKTARHTLRTAVFRRDQMHAYKDLKTLAHLKTEGQESAEKALLIKDIRGCEGVFLSPATLSARRSSCGKVSLSRHIRLIEELPCYHHSWRPYDILIYDNSSLLHKREAFDAKEARELQRVSFSFSNLLQKRAAIEERHAQ